MGMIKKILGICRTNRPAAPDAWRYAGGQLEIDLTHTPELSSPGGAVRLEGGNLPYRVLVMRGSDGEFHAFPNRCAHVGKRRLDPIEGGGRLQCCSVGQSVYDLSGQRLSGSAKTGIQPLPVDKENHTLTIKI